MKFIETSLKSHTHLKQEQWITQHLDILNEATEEEDRAFVERDAKGSMHVQHGTYVVYGSASQTYSLCV